MSVQGNKKRHLPRCLFYFINFFTQREVPCLTASCRQGILVGQQKKTSTQVSFLFYQLFHSTGGSLPDCVMQAGNPRRTINYLKNNVCDLYLTNAPKCQRIPEGSCKKHSLPQS